MQLITIIIIIVTFLQRKPCPEDYRLWLESMYSLFGTKFVKLFNGPMWKVEPSEMNGDDISQSRDPVQVGCN